MRQEDQSTRYTFKPPAIKTTKPSAKKVLPKKIIPNPGLNPFMMYVSPTLSTNPETIPVNRAEEAKANRLEEMTKALVAQQAAQQTNYPGRNFGGTTARPPLPVVPAPGSNTAPSTSRNPDELIQSPYGAEYVRAFRDLADARGRDTGWLPGVHGLYNIPLADGGDYTTPPVTPPPATGGGGGEKQKEPTQPELPNEPAGPGKPTWKETYHIPGAPDWWRGIVANQTNPELEYAMLMNSIIPFLSAEDQRAVATNLAIQFPEAFGMYSAVGGQFPNPTTEMGIGGRRSNTETNGILFQGQPFGSQFGNNTYSRERANAILNALETVKSKMKVPEGGLGPGYAYLQQVASAIRDFGGTNGQGATRQQYQQLMGALDPLLAATKADNLAAYGPASRMLTQPFFSAGSVLPVTKLDTGEYIFGSPNVSLF